MGKKSFTLSVENLESRFNLSTLAGAAPLSKLVPSIADPSLNTRTTSLQATLSRQQVTPISLASGAAAPLNTVSGASAPPTSSGLPSGWKDKDVATTGIAGSASYSNGTFTLKGSGWDIWSNYDEFNYSYQTLAGDGTIVARVTGVTNSNPWAKAGVMIRSSLAANSAFADMLVTPSSGAAFQDRTSAGTQASNVSVGGITAPYYVKIQRTGNTLTGSISSDGSTWKQVGTVNIAMGSNVYVGLVACAHTDSALTTATFDHVTISNTSTVTTVPAAPTSLKATAASTSQINLAWSESSTNQTGFTVQQSTDGTTFTSIATTAAGTTSYSATGLTAGKTYYYRVAASNSAGSSGYSAVANATTLTTTPVVTVPAAPGGLQATVASTSQINLAWTESSTSQTGFSVQQSTDGSTFTQIATTSASTMSYSATGLSAGTTYYYRVTASNSAGSSGYSSVVNATTQSTTPVPTPTPGTIGVMTPGSGWSGATAQPANVGTSSTSGYTAEAIAHWDTVPMQSFTGSLTVGVDAFHVNGIDHVAFSVNGGAWVNATQMTLNPISNVWEYNATLNAASCTDGQVEVRAVVYPKDAGKPRVLESLFLNADGHGALATPTMYVDATNGNDSTGNGTAANPYKTIAGASQGLYKLNSGANGADNATIYLAAGQYQWYAPSTAYTASTQKGWLTIAAAPGVAQSAVTIVNPSSGLNNDGGIYATNIHLQNVTLQASLYNSPSLNNSLWLDNVTVAGSGLNDANNYMPQDNWSGGMYVTSSTANNVVEGFINCNLVRNSTVNGVFDDALSDSINVINSEVKNQLGQSSYHSDIWQQRTDGEDNIILYGVKAVQNDYDQGIFSASTGASNIAIVNCDIYEQGYPAQNQWFTKTNHMVIQYNTFLGTPFDIWTQSSTAGIGYTGSTNVSIDHNVFQWMQTDASYATLQQSAGTTIDSNQFLDQWPAYMANAGQNEGDVPVGTNATTGSTIAAGLGAFGTAQPPMKL